MKIIFAASVLIASILSGQALANSSKFGICSSDLEMILSMDSSVAYITGWARDGDAPSQSALQKIEESRDPKFVVQTIINWNEYNIAKKIDHINNMRNTLRSAQAASDQNTAKMFEDIWRDNNEELSKLRNDAEQAKRCLAKLQNTESSATTATTGNGLAGECNCSKIIGRCGATIDVRPTGSPSGGGYGADLLVKSNAGNQCSLVDFYIDNTPYMVRLANKSETVDRTYGQKPVTANRVKVVNCRICERK